MYKQDAVERWFLGVPFKGSDEEVGSTLKKLRTERAERVNDFETPTF